MNAITAIRPAAGGELEPTILMPCLNEAETLALCIGKARAFLDRARIAGEVLVAENGSTGGSREIAITNGARVVPAARKGYGAALQGGIAAAGGFGPPADPEIPLIVVLGLSPIVISLQAFFSAFLLGVPAIPVKRLKAGPADRIEVQLPPDAA